MQKTFPGHNVIMCILASFSLTGEEDFCLLEDKDRYLAAEHKDQAKTLIEKEKEETGSVSRDTFNSKTVFPYKGNPTVEIKRL